MNFKVNHWYSSSQTYSDWTISLSRAQYHYQTELFESQAQESSKPASFHWSLSLTKIYLLFLYLVISVSIVLHWKYYRSCKGSALRGMEGRKSLMFLYLCCRSDFWISSDFLNTWSLYFWGWKHLQNQSYSIPSLIISDNSNSYWQASRCLRGWCNS